MLFTIALNKANKQWLANERLVRRLYQVKKAETQELLLQGCYNSDVEFVKLAQRVKLNKAKE